MTSMQLQPLLKYWVLQCCQRRHRGPAEHSSGGGLIEAACQWYLSMLVPLVAARR
jgi:hypothetical protein